MTVTHPSMRRAKTESKPTTVQKPEVYVVEDSTTSSSADIVAANDQAALKKAQADAKPKNKEITSLLEDLLFLGCAKKEVEIGSIKFEICTLTQKENSELVRELYKISDGSDLFAIRALTLAYAVKYVNGVPFGEVPLSSFEEEAQFETALEKKTALLEQMQKNIVEKLHDEYISLVENSDKALDDDKGEDLKN